jgi:uncharacterized membrane protein YtjA (UPF0391 family)
MKAVATALQEVYGLFVEDGSYAVAIIVWLAAAGFLFPHIAGAGAWRGPILFVGMAAIMLESVIRAAKRR